MVDTTVKYFNSTMTGAPALSGTEGALIGVLDACLVNGFGSVTLDSLVVASNVATGTLSTGHNFAMVGTTGPVITIAGATPAEFNGEWRIASVPGSTTFTFATTGISDQTATGTITAKRSPAGFTKAYSGTNKAAYQSSDMASSMHYLRVQDGTTWATCGMYRTMSDIDTGDLASTAYYAKSSAANSTAHPWFIYADDRALFMSCQPDHVNWPLFCPDIFFGDVTSYLSPDAYACVLIGNPAQSQWYDGFFYRLNVDYGGAYVSKNATGVGNAEGIKLISHDLSGDRIGKAGATYPNPAGSEFLCAFIEIWNTALNTARGLIPGIYNPLHAYSNFADGALISNVMPNNREMMIRRFQGSVTGYYSAIAFDITGPWR